MGTYPNPDVSFSEVAYVRSDPLETVARHNRPGDAWIVINESVYDISGPPHPGGFEVLKPYLGRDATAAFFSQHNLDMLAIVEKNLVGVIDRDDEEWKQEREAAKDRATDNGLLTRRAKLAPISHILNTRDMAQVAESVMDPPGWAYYASAADDEVTLRENEAAFGRLWLRPRVLVDVSKVDTSAELLGVPSSFPLYVTATALAKLADPEGEVAITRACAKANVPYMCPTLSSCSLEEMTSARAPDQTQWFQLYVNKDRAVAKDLLQRAETGGCKAVFVTVDAPQLGRRERDMRFKAPQKSSVQEGDTEVDTSRGHPTHSLPLLIPRSRGQTSNGLRVSQNFLSASKVYSRERMPCLRPNAERRLLWCRTTGDGSSTMREAVWKFLSK